MLIARTNPSSVHPSPARLAGAGGGGPEGGGASEGSAGRCCRLPLHAGSDAPQQGRLLHHAEPRPEQVGRVRLHEKEEEGALKDFAPEASVCLSLPSRSTSRTHPCVFLLLCFFVVNELVDGLGEAVDRGGGVFRCAQEKIPRRRAPPPYPRPVLNTVHICV